MEKFNLLKRGRSLILAPCLGKLHFPLLATSHPSPSKGPPDPPHGINSSEVPIGLKRILTAVQFQKQLRPPFCLRNSRGRGQLFQLFFNTKYIYIFKMIVVKTRGLSFPPETPSGHNQQARSRINHFASQV